MSDELPPTVAEALERLRGRRADAIVEQSRVRVVVETRGQNRKTRRNNLRKAKVPKLSAFAAAKAAKLAAEIKATGECTLAEMAPEECEPDQ